MNTIDFILKESIRRVRRSIEGVLFTHVQQEEIAGVNIRVRINWKNQFNNSMCLKVPDDIHTGLLEDIVLTEVHYTSLVVGLLY